METLDDNPAKITATHRARNRAALSAITPDLWISPFAYESFLMVNAACDRWLQRRAQLRRKRDDARAAADGSARISGDNASDRADR